METGILIVLVAIIVVETIVMGLVVYSSVTRLKKSQGKLNIDYSDPDDGPYLFLELKVPIADVVSKKQVLFDVNVTQYISQK